MVLVALFGGTLAVAGLRVAALQRGIAMKTAGSLSKQEQAEEAYWRAWFWDQASEAIEERFAGSSKRELKRIREFVKANRNDAPLPSKLRKHPHYEVVGGYFPGLTTVPFHDASGAQWSALGGAFPQIKRELQALLEREQEFKDMGKPLGWKSMPIFYRGLPCADFPSEDCPGTMAALGSMRLAGETVAFQRQSPGTGLPLHVDPCSWVLACHLGITCPDEGGDVGSPFIKVAGTKYHWSDGEVMLFDPSFRHETFNPTSQERIILNIDLYHPELTDLECEAIELTIALKKKLFGSTEAELHETRR